MIRFCEENISENSNVDIAMVSEYLTLGENLWNDGKEYLKGSFGYDTADVQMIPVNNKNHEFICYAYQDNEANRELRMLKELRGNKDALQFIDIFPEYKEVVIYGCNELAVSFAGYLQGLGVAVSIVGKYWNFFGYTARNEVDLLRGGGQEACYICRRHTLFNR